MLYETMRRSIAPIALGAALTVLAPVRMVAQTCTGDCDGDVKVSIAELIRGVNIALGLAELSSCPAFDDDGDRKVAIYELVSAVVNALHDCAIRPTPTATPVAMGTPTATHLVTVTPVPTATPIPTAPSTPTTIIGNQPPTAVDDAAATLVGESIHVFVLANDSDPNDDPLHVTTFTQPANGTISFADDVATYTPPGEFSGSDEFTYTIGDGHGGSASAIVTLVVTAMPPDPAGVAPPPANGVATIVGDAASFLFSGMNAVQFDVAPGTIAPLRAAVVRGSVRTRGGDPLPGVRITVLDHPELGFTASRADGMFDLVVNGGGSLTVDYQKTGFCPVQRQLTVPWQDYATAPDVVMTAMDPLVTAVALGTNSTFQVAQSSMQSDADGTRHAMMLFTPGTSASVVLANGTMQAVSSLHVRATEFTVGARGPAAMPAVLPPSSGYTYAVELSADEAMAQSGSTVQFDRPVFTYLENFIGFPVGMAVPAGFYDRTRAAWVPSQNGRVVKILSIAGGLADVDTDGDAAADNTDISDGERAQLASLYAAGQTLWRVPVTHFTPWDFNWPMGPPGDVITPGANGAGAANADDPLQDPTNCNGCILEVENQVLGHVVPIVGTPYTLNYRSDRVPGRAKALDVTLSGPAAVPADLQSIEMHLTVAGQTVDQSFSPAPNQQTTFVWDGRDAYGRPSQGGQLVAGSIDYIYPAVYRDPSAQAASFSQYGDTITGTFRQDNTIALSQPIAQVLGEGYADARTIGLGGWTLNVHHFYDPVSRVLAKGDGSRRRVGNLSRVIETAAADLNLNETSKVKVAPDGSVFIAESRADRVLKVATDGTVSVFAGGGHPDDGLGDGGPATSALLHLPIGLAFGNDGSVYISDFQQSRVRRVGPDGIITTVAGTGEDGHSDDPGPATQAQLFGPSGLAVGADGSLFIADGGNSVIRRATPDGIINTIGGGGVLGFPFAEGRKATDALLGPISGIVLGPDGSVYVAAQASVYRISPDGIITTVAGDGNTGSTGDGGPATAARLSGAVDVALAPDGTLYIAEESGSRVRAVRPDGIIVEVAGNGLLSSPTGDGGPATMATIGGATGVAVAPDGSLYIASAQFFHSGIRRVQPVLPGFTNAPFTIASEDGSELYEFDAFGRHLRTLNTLTGATLFEFGYDANGLLTQVAEKTGGADNVTTIQHDGAGNPVSITGPFGQQTTLAIDANGFLATISNPAGEQTRFGSTADGLLSSQTDPRGNTSTYMYDAMGRLTLDADPAGGSQALAHVVMGSESTVTRTSALGRKTTYTTETLTDGNTQRRTVIAPDGTQFQSTEAIDAGTTHTSSTDGTTSDRTLGPDPRFSMEGPVLTNFSVQLPSMLQFNGGSTRSAELSNSADPLSLVSFTEATTFNGRTSSDAYSAATRTLLSTSAAGRTLSLTVDSLGRVVTSHVAGLDAVRFTYDDRGRLSSIVRGEDPTTRSVTFSYNPDRFLESITDPLGRVRHFTYDAAGRMHTKTLFDGGLVRFDYDATGNVIALVPAGHPAYTFDYSDRNELTQMIPPVVAGTGPTGYTYNLDKQLSTVLRPDGRSINLDYDDSGRLAARRLATGSTTTGTDTLSYDASGRLSSVVAASGVTTDYAYDGSLLAGESWSGTITGSVTRSYNADFGLASQRVNDADAVNFSYDGDGRLLGAGDLTITRDPQNGVVTATSLGVVSAAVGYNGFGEPVSFSSAAGDAPLFSETLTRDGLGRVTQNVETVDGVTDTYVYAYDAVGRLSGVTKNAVPAEVYGYDTNGNRISATIGGTSITAMYDDQDRLTSYGSEAFTYNGAGDLLTKSVGAQSTGYDYDQIGNLLGVVLPDGTSISYVVDGKGRRVGKRIDGTLTQAFLYGDRLRPAAELDGTGTVISRFVYAGSHVPAYMVRTGIAYRFITDQIGSVRLVVDAATGAIAQRIDYDTFGNVLSDTNPGFQPFGFAGGLYDPDTQLVRFGNRDYDAAVGRWTTKDPVFFRSGRLNLYSYVSADPINRSDVSGLAEEKEPAFGFNVEICLIQPVTSSGGGICGGLNGEFVFGGENKGVGLFGYTPTAAPSSGLSLGVSGEFNAAVGSGAWTGLFNNVGVGFDTVALGYFESPDLSKTGDGWFGYSIGLGAGCPLTAAEYQTNYVELANTRDVADAIDPWLQKFYRDVAAAAFSLLE